MDIYNASQYSDVLKFKKSEKQILTDFLNNFDGKSDNKYSIVSL